VAQVEARRSGRSMTTYEGGHVELCASASRPNNRSRLTKLLGHGRSVPAAPTEHMHHEYGKVRCPFMVCLLLSSFDCCVFQMRIELLAFSLLFFWTEDDLNHGQFGFIRFSCLGFLCCMLFLLD